jgi:hypothetical protein
MMSSRLLLASFALVMAAPASAAFTLNTFGGPGTVIVDVPGVKFTLVGKTDKGLQFLRYETFTTTAATVSGDFFYQAVDAPSGFHEAGYRIGLADEFQLSADLPPFGSNSGSFSFNVAAGDSFGFYINSFVEFGEGRLTIDRLKIDPLKVDVIPEPGSWATLIAGFGLVGSTLRRRRRAVMS